MHASCFICYLLCTEKDNTSNLCLRKQRDSPCHSPICPHTCAQTRSAPWLPQRTLVAVSSGAPFSPPWFITNIKLERNSSVFVNFSPKCHPATPRVCYHSVFFYYWCMQGHSLQPVGGHKKIPLLGWSQGWCGHLGHCWRLRTEPQCSPGTLLGCSLAISYLKNQETATTATPNPTD